MATLRNKFHELGNWHNKISLAVLVTKEILQDIDLAKISKEELAEILEKSVIDLNKVSGFIEGADKAVNDMKPYIYERIGGDMEIGTKADPQQGGHNV